MFWTKATWENSKTGEIVEGSWCYNKAFDLFHICLRNKCKYSGGTIHFDVAGESPEWLNWKRVDK